MIILRQKLFTRAEREAIRQIYRVTDGLRRLPTGVTNLEDAKALKNLAIKLNEGGQPFILRQEERDALNRLGFTKLSSGNILERIHQKYNNGLLLARTKRIKKPRRMTSEEKRRNSAKFKNLKEEQGQEAKLLKDPTGLPNSERVIKFVNDKMPSTSVLEIQPKSTPSAVWEPSMNSKVRENTLREFETSTGLTDTGENVLGANRFISGETSGLIGTRKDIPEIGTVHEISHNYNTKTIPSANNYETAQTRLVNPRYGLIMKDVGNLAEENLASSRALNLLKNKGNRADNKIYLDNKLISYIGDAKRNIWKIKRSRN